MSRRLIALNALFVVLAIGAVGYIAREASVPAPSAGRRSSAPSAQAPQTAATPEPAPGTYNIVATRNLFSPTRSEIVDAAPPAAAVALPKPNLFGILLREGAPVAYLEDPTTKRVAGYRLGDTVAGGTVKQITADQVVLNRPEGDVNVRLRDPGKPRPPAPPQAGAPAQPVPGPAVPGAPTPGTTTPPTAQAQPPAVGPLPPGTPPVLPRRPLPPNLLRRVPPTAPDAPAQQ